MPEVQALGKVIEACLYVRVRVRVRTHTRTDIHTHTP